MTSEVVAGAMALKMLCWEGPFLRAITGSRAQEEREMMRIARIRALNFALVFAAGPIMALAMFSVAAYHYQELSVPSLYYALALLNLPRVSMTNWFVMGGWCVCGLRRGAGQGAGGGGRCVCAGGCSAAPRCAAGWRVRAEDAGGQLRVWARPAGAQAPQARPGASSAG
jgi:hypothetical protein